jgi:hypothetical protein
LKAWAAHQFALDKPVTPKSATTRRVMLEDYEGRTGKIDAELDGPPFPDGLEYIWAWFCELDAARTSNGYSANPISWHEVDAWARLRRRRPTGFELDCLAGLDQVRVESLAKK